MVIRVHFGSHRVTIDCQGLLRDEQLLGYNIPRMQMSTNGGSNPLFSGLIAFGVFALRKNELKKTGVWSIAYCDVIRTMIFFFSLLDFD